jgi:hypothetical protein
VFDGFLDWLVVVLRVAGFSVLVVVLGALGRWLTVVGREPASGIYVSASNTSGDRHRAVSASDEGR